MQQMDFTYGGGKKVTATYKGFSFPADQPADYGGEGSAPEPVDFFFAAIGTCTAYTVHAFCQSRDLDMEGIRVVAHLEEDESGKKIVSMRHEIHIPANFPEKYAKALVRAAGTCSVKKYLAEPPVVETVTVREGG